MKTIELSDATGKVAEYAYEALREPITFTLDGRPVAFMACAVGADEETIALSASVRFQRIIERSRESVRKYGRISQEEMRRRIEQWEAEERAEAESESSASSS